MIEKLERQATGVGPRTPLLEHAAGGHTTLIKHVPPLNLCLSPWVLGEDFYQAAKFGIVQYVRPGCRPSICKVAAAYSLLT